MSSNYDLVTKKLGEVGANFIESLNNGDDEFEALDLWNVHGTGLIVAAHEDGKCGLYKFVGLDGDPVYKDLEFIETLAKKNQGWIVVNESQTPNSCPFCGVAPEYGEADDLAPAGIWCNNEDCAVKPNVWIEDDDDTFDVLLCQWNSRQEVFNG